MFLEVKIPTSNRVSEDQKKFLKAVKERGSIAAVVKSIDDVIKVLKEADGLMTDRGYLGK